MQPVQPFPKRRWLRILLQVLLAVIALALIFLIALPALLAPKPGANPPIRLNR